jgi:hypothetical protein
MQNPRIGLHEQRGIRFVWRSAAKSSENGRLKSDNYTELKDKLRLGLPNVQPAGTH